MKKLNKLILTFCLIAASIFSQAQDKQQQNTIKVKVIQEIDGKQEVIEKEYNTIEELESDPDLRDLDITIPDRNRLDIDSKNGADIQVLINKVKKIHSDKGVMLFKEKKGDSDRHLFHPNGEDFDMKAGGYEIKMGKTEEGKLKIFKNGEEIRSFDMKELRDRDGEIIHLGANDDNGTFVFNMNGSGSTEAVIEEVNQKMEGDIKIERKYKLKVIMNKITIEDLKKGDVSAHELDLGSHKLKLEDLSYYPNPNDGRFTLQFAAENQPTEVKIMDLNGREIYSELLKDFSGNYNNEINLNGQDPGVYILQVVQNNNTMNKKIVVE